MVDRINHATRPWPLMVLSPGAKNIRGRPAMKPGRSTAGWCCPLAATAMLLFPGSAVAVQCASSAGYSQLSAQQISNLLVGSLACYPASPPYENQQTIAGGKIIDYKKGPNDPADPTATVGTYRVTDGADPTITYSYGSGPSFTYAVWGTTTSGSGQYDFCSGGSPITMRVVAGSSGPC